MFKDNKYKKIYFNIIEKAKLKHYNYVYTEKHHIIPKSLGGLNNKNNIVKLSYREHFICHWLLIYMVENSLHKRKMQMAFFRMTHSTEKQKRIINSKYYEIAKKHHKEAWSRPCSEETKIKIGNANRGKKWNGSAEEKLKRSEKWKKANPSHDPEIMKKIVDNKSKLWEIIKPDGERLVIKNLSKFCRENNLMVGNMNSVANGNLKHYKNYKCSYYKQ